MRVALTREISESFAECELTFAPRQPIDLRRARAQHLAYESLLQRQGWEVRRLPAGPDLPDSVFIEDTAIVLDEVAILARPGAESRRGEIPAVEEALKPLRPVERIESPATLDGGDVLRVGHRLFIGRSSRTNDLAAEQIRSLGHPVIAVPVTGCLHLKSGVSAVDANTLLINRAWIDPVYFKDFKLIDVDPSEPAAANVLSIHGTVFVAASSPRTRDRLERSGFKTESLDVSEIAKAEGGLTCCSLLLP